MHVTAKAPVNIALIKYWGKQDEDKVIPYNSSLSLSLDNLYTITTLSYADNFSFALNGKEVDGVERDKVYEFLLNFASIEEVNKTKVVSRNFVPTAAGLASSASGFAALSKAANTFYKTNYDLQKLAQITRLGSGSACRSLLGAFVAWDKNGEVYQVNSKVKDFVMISVVVDSNKKLVSSREAMKRSVLTSPSFDYFVSESNKDFDELINSLSQGDIEKIGNLTHKSFLLLHGTMLSSMPPILYMNQDSIKVIELTEELRSQNIYAYPTMDAGSNVKILSLESHYNEVIKVLKQNGFNNLFVSRPGRGAMIIDE